MKDLAIAISVYDKFQDVRILVDLFRKNWPGNYYITVCSSHPDPSPHLKGCDIDRLLVTDNFPLEGEKITDPRIALRARLWVRVIDSLKKACDDCAHFSTAPFTLNIQADACPLSWPKLKKILETMEKQEKYMGAHGEGFGFYSFNEPLGAFDDMFVIIDNHFAKKVDLWKFDSFDFLPHKISIHGLLAILGLTRVGLRHFYHYGDHSETIYWDGKPVYLHPFNPAQPMYFDPKHDFLHIHETAFPGNLAFRLKAHYLNHYGLTKGETIQKFLDTWLTPEKKLFEELAQMEKNLRRFFTRKGLLSSSYGRNFDIMTAIINRYSQQNWQQKLTWLKHSYIQQGKGLFSKFIRNQFKKKYIYLQDYPDCIWPDKMDPLYEKTYHKTPKELRNFSFDPSLTI